MKETILILGGYGNTGRLIAEYLLPECQANITLAGRDGARAEELARLLQKKYPGRVSALKLDAGDAAAMHAALEVVQLLVSASSTSQYAEETARACLDQAVDYLDVQYSTGKIKVLQSLRSQMERQPDLHHRRRIPSRPAGGAVPLCSFEARPTAQGQCGQRDQNRLEAAYLIPGHC